MVIIMIVMRWIFDWKEYIRPEHFDSLARLLIVVATGWFFFFTLEFVFGLYGQESDEIAIKHMLASEWPWNMLFIVFIVTTYFIPVGMWLIRSVRRNPWWMLLTCILVNIGMWLERLVLFIPAMSKKQVLEFNWTDYAPSAIEITIIGGTFALVSMLMLIFAKIFPLIPLYDIKEGEVLRDEIQIGRRSVPAVVREE